MRIVDVVGTAVNNSFRSKLRTTLTVVAIFIGAFTLTITNGSPARYSSAGASPMPFNDTPENAGPQAIASRTCLLILKGECLVRIEVKTV